MRADNDDVRAVSVCASDDFFFSMAWADLDCPIEIAADMGPDRFFPTEDAVKSNIFNELDSEICSTCRARIFEECQRVP